MAANKYFSQEQIFKIFQLFYITKLSKTEIGDLFSVHASTIMRLLSNPKHSSIYEDVTGNFSLENVVVEEDDEIADARDQELVEQNILLAKKVQRLQDAQRIERKTFREHARVDNAAVEMGKELNAALENKIFDLDTTKWKVPKGSKKAPVGVIHFTDHHLNEVVNDLQSNKFDIYVASKRIQKHVEKSKNWFKSNGVKHVMIAMTGDMIKNTQFISEITEMSTSRSNIVMLAVEIYTQVIIDLNNAGFNVSVATVIGNESRMSKDFENTDFLAFDSFDSMIHKILTIVFRDAKGVDIIPMVNPIECVVTLNGQNLLLVHGNIHSRLAGTSTIEKSTAVIKSRYASLGIKIDYLLCGHIHSCYMSDNFARSSSIVGSNTFSERTLNLTGKASHNSFLFYEDSSIDGIKTDLQNTDGYSGYNIDDCASEMMIDLRTAKKGNTTIISSYTI